MTFKTKFTNTDTDNYKTWVSFHPQKEVVSPFRLRLEKYGYFDPRPQLITNITSLLAVTLPFFNLWFLPLSIFFLFWGWGNIYLKLPFDTGKNNECDSPEYGIMTYSYPGKIIDELWLTWGKKRKHIGFPWQFIYYRKLTQLKDGEWFIENKKNKLNWIGEDYGSYKWLEENKHKETHAYTYVLNSGKIQEREVTITVNQIEWRRRFLYFTSLFSKVRSYIDIEFDKEVGEKSGSWKGGIVGCLETMKKGETPLECLRRMEKERKF